VKIQKESEDKDMRRGMITSIDTLTQVSVMFREKNTENKKMGINVEQNTKKIRMNMVINVYEYGRERKCVSMFRYTHAGMRIIQM